MPHGGQDAEGKRRLVGAFQFVHALAHHEQSGEGVAFVQRQRERAEAETIAQGTFVLRRAQIDGDHGADFDLAHGFALLFEVGAECPGDRGQQNVIDRAAKGLAQCLDLGQREGVAPRNVLDRTGLALEAGG